MAKRMIKGVDIETSSGNVFADLGFSRAACKLPRPDIHSAIRKLLGLAKLNTESPGQVGQALDGCSTRGSILQTHCTCHQRGRRRHVHFQCAICWRRGCGGQLCPPSRCAGCRWGVIALSRVKRFPGKSG